MALNTQHEKQINDPTSVIAKKTAGGAGVLSFPLDSSDYNFFSLTFREFQYATAAKQKEHIVKETIILPLPTNGIMDNLQMNYDSQELGALTGAAAKEIAAGIDSIGGAMNKGGTMSEKGHAAMTGYIAEVRKSVMAGAAKVKNMGAADAAATINAAVGSGGAISSAIGNALGQAPNPHVTAIFRGINLRDFSFTFKLIPNNIQEANQINKILNVIRSRALPKRNPNTGGLTLNYPHEAEISIVTGSAATGGKINTIRFKPCHVTTVGINHSSEGMQFYRDGQPLGRDLSLSFKEIDFWRADDYDEPEDNSAAFDAGPF
jgi:hypothetical protein